MRLDLFVKFKHQSNIKILSVGIKYSVRDLLYVNNYSWPANAICFTLNYLRPPSGIISR